MNPRNFAHDPNQAFVERLDAIRDDPYQVVLAMEDDMEVELAQRFEIEDWTKIKGSPETVDAIDLLRSLVSGLCTRGLFTPQALGLLLSSPIEDMAERTPFDFVISELKEGVDQAEVAERIMALAAPFLENDSP